MREFVKVAAVVGLALVLGMAATAEDAPVKECCKVAAGDTPASAATEGKAVDDCCAVEEKTGAAKPGTDLAKVESVALACTLTDQAKRARRTEFGEKLAGYITKTVENETGFTAEFENGHAAEIVEFVELERECCSFFSFTLSFAPNGGPTTLEISGPDGAKEFLAEAFRPQAAGKVSSEE